MTQDRSACSAVSRPGLDASSMLEKITAHATKLDTCSFSREFLGTP